MEQKCRTCMCEDGEYQSIFISDESTGLNIHLAEMIMGYSTIQITLGDGLPEQICNSCARKASELYLFKLKCEESDTTLRANLGKSPLRKPYTIKEEKPEYQSTFIADEEFVALEVKPELCSLEDQKDIFNTMDDIPKVPTLSVTSLQVEDITTKEISMKGYRCDQCPKVYNQKFKLNNHKRVHARKSFYCDLCTKSFSRHDTFIRHKKLHDKEGMVSSSPRASPIVTNAEECDENLSDKLMDNEIEEEEDDDFMQFVKYKCEYCGVDCKAKDTYDAHILTHRSETPCISCSICKKRVCI